jgi:hypothetical protein
MINSELRFVVPKIGVNLRPMSYLFDRDGGAEVPNFLFKDSSESIDLGDYGGHTIVSGGVPDGFEVYNFAHGARLPVGSKISKAITV